MPLSQSGHLPANTDRSSGERGRLRSIATFSAFFPGGDVTSLLFGFDAAGKITGVGVGGMAGD
jgi:hypothetical protein